MGRRLVMLVADVPWDEFEEPDAVAVRLVGDRPTERPAPQVARAADSAAARVRSVFPSFLWDWIRGEGALDLAEWDGVSWWWYTPLSEKSPLRSPLVNDLYRLTFLRELLACDSFDEVVWYGDDPLLASAAGRVVKGCGVRFRHIVSQSRRGGLASLAVRRLVYLAYVLARWILLRTLGFARRAPRGADVVLYSRFPVLWERAASGWRERMFGRWPAVLKERGHRPIYAAVLSAGPRELLERRRELRRACRREGIVVLDALLSPLDVLRANLTVRFLARYLRWRAVRRRRAVVYDGIDVTDLFWRELDGSAFATEIPLDLMIAKAFRALIARSPSVRTVFLPFEYQPMERAVWAGVKAIRDVAVVGLQTALFTSNQMGFTFPVEEKRSESNPRGAPVPDVVAAYGELAHRVFAERLGQSRVCLSGPIRYPDLGETKASVALSAGALPETGLLLLVPTPMTRHEALPLLRACFTIASKRPDIFLLLKFHYHLNLTDEVERLGREFQMRRYAIFDADLRALMGVAPVTVCGGSSVGVEALLSGSMPLVYRSLGILSANPMLDVPDAVFFWYSVDDLRSAVESCTQKDDDYRRRIDAWDRAVRDHVFRVDGAAEERLYEFLRSGNLVGTGR